MPGLDAVMRKAATNSAAVFTYALDVGRTEELETLCDSIFANMDLARSGCVVLINNAATIAPIGRVGRLGSAEVEKAVRVNLVSVLVLMNGFIRRCVGHERELRIVNISSGAAETPISGWSAYCAAKAAMNSFSAVVLKEQQTALRPVKVVCFDPGVMDTGMQEQIRKSRKEDCPDVGLFLEYHRLKRLRKPESVAEVVRKAYIDNWLAKRPFERVGEYDAGQKPCCSGPASRSAPLTSKPGRNRATPS